MTTLANEWNDPGPDTGCSLREAITAANTDADFGGCTATDYGDDTIVLANGTYTLDVADNTGTLVGDNGLPMVTSTITIQGNGATITRSAAPATPDFRIFEVDSTGDLTLESVTIANGRTFCDDACVPYEGGGILNRGTLTVTGSTITGNVVRCEWDSCEARGGGIASFGPLTIDSDTTLSDNVASCTGPSCLTEGGGLYAGGIQGLSVTASRFEGNSVDCTASTQIALAVVADQGACTARGGGIRLNGVLNVADTTLSENVVGCNTSGSVAQGGAIFENGQLVLSGSTLSQNEAACEVADCTAEGGGLYIAEGFASGALVRNSTFFANSVACVVDSADCVARGGGIANFAAFPNPIPLPTPETFVFGLILQASTLSANAIECDACGGGAAQVFSDDPGFAFLAQTIVANSGGSNNCLGPIEDGGFNLSDDASCLFTLADSQNEGSDALATALADNGGPTMTLALLTGSDAIDAGGDCTLASIPFIPPVTEDQRGIARPQGPSCDIGAFESVGLTTIATPTADLGDPISDTATLTGLGAPAGAPDGIVFEAFGPNDPDCQGPAAFTSPVVDVTEDGPYGSPEFVPVTEGTYLWVATYSGDDNNPSVATLCGDPGETSVVAVEDDGDGGTGGGLVADLAIAKTGPGSAQVGQSFTYGLMVTNNGPDMAVNVVVTDVLPAQVAFSSASPGCALNGSTVVCSTVTLAAGASAGFTIVVNPTQVGTAVNIATVTATTADPHLADNTSAAVQTVIGGGGTGITIFEITEDGSGVNALAAGTVTFGFHTKNLKTKTFRLDEGDSRRFKDLKAGTYTIAQDKKSGWKLDKIVCVDPSHNTKVKLDTRRAVIKLKKGETVVCTFFNKKK